MFGDKKKKKNVDETKLYQPEAQAYENKGAQATNKVGNMNQNKAEEEVSEEISEMMNKAEEEKKKNKNKENKS